MEPGARDRYVAIHAATDDTGTDGFPGQAWTAMASVWMSKRDVGGAERLRAGQVDAQFDTIWEMSYRADMDPELIDVPKTRRLVYQGRTFQIVAAGQIGRREGVEIMTVALAAVA